MLRNVDESTRQHNLRTLALVGGLMAAISLFGAGPVTAEITLPHIIGSNMVLQRDVPIPVWGWSAPGEKITVRLGKNEARTETDKDGAWKVELPAMKAGGPHEMTLTGKNAIRLTNILIGEVWLCSGQSNMEMGVGVVKDGEKEVAAANYPEIRLFFIPRQPSGQPLPDLDAEWRICSPETIANRRWGGFSAVGYFFGRELHGELGVPVGLIDSTWGGTRIEPWTPVVGFESVPELDQIVKEIKQANMQYRKDIEPSLGLVESWVEETREALAEGTEIPLRPDIPHHPLNSWARPTGLYNGMIHPLVPFGIRGAIWYQGESNTRPLDELYFEKEKALILGWRKLWGQGEFPFYFVQLAPFNYGYHVAETSPFLMPRIREAQVRALSIPNTGMVVTTDIGNLRDIHPANKLDVGKRLALVALAKTYGRKDLVYSGPLYKSMTIEDGKARIEFDHIGTGLASRDGKSLTWFQIAGEDRKFVDASAEIDAEEVVVWSDSVSKPVAVRFGWHMEAVPNLMNKEGLPASPFRTDDWQK